MTVRTIARIFGYASQVVSQKPIRGEREELRSFPTYSIPEAAASIAASPRTLRAWYQDTNLLSATTTTDGIHYLSFEDLTEAFVLYNLRNWMGYSMQRVRVILDNLRAESRTERPLLDDNLGLLLGHLVLNKNKRGKRPRQVIDMCIRGRQLALPELYDLIGKRILRDSRGHPYKIFPWRLLLEDEQSAPVSMSPDVMSGRLVVSGTRITVETLLALRAGGRQESEIARIYRLDPAIVKKVFQHIDRPIHQKAS